MAIISVFLYTVEDTMPPEEVKAEFEKILARLEVEITEVEHLTAYASRSDVLKRDPDLEQRLLTVREMIGTIIRRIHETGFKIPPHMLRFMGVSRFHRVLKTGD